MKNGLIAVFFAALLSAAGAAHPCVGKTIAIGIPDSPEHALFAELLSVMINERTGTTVSVKKYAGSKEIYEALGTGEVGIIIENTDYALNRLGRPREDSVRRAYEIAREGFRKSFNLVWLEPFGRLSGGASLTNAWGPVLTVEVLNNFPALPRVINKLSGAIDTEALAGMTRSMESGKKPRTAAKDFLRAKKLI